MSIFSFHKKTQKSIHKSFMNESQGHASYLLALEPRIMYDAAGLVTAVEGAEDASQTAETGEDISTESFQDKVSDIQAAFENYVPPVQDAPKEIIFISTAVPDYQQLVQGASPNAEIILLNPEEDGLTQISNALADYTDLDAIHIVSHGGPGSLLLGQNNLTIANISENAEHLKAWGESVSDDGDILLYGCDVAAGEKGQAFIQQLSEVTGADVAASIDTTGATELGGDWDLEEQTGDIETILPFTNEVLDTYDNVLPNSAPVLDNTGNMIFTSISKDTSDSSGDLVTEIIASDGGDRITDVDADPEGVAVITVDNANGDWQYSLDNGSNWISFGAGVSDTSATLLSADSNTRIRFVPDASYVGTVGIVFRAWDHTSGANGDTGVDVSTNGGVTPYSSATETASIYVDDIPILVSSAVTPYIENDPAIVIDNGIILTDDSVNMIGAKITISANFIEGEDVLNFTPIGNITGGWDASSATLTLSGVDTIANYQTALRSVTFRSDSDNPGEAGGLSRTISFEVDDGLSKSSIATSTVNITPVNDAPLADTVTPHDEIIYIGSPEYENGLSLAEKTYGHNFDIDGDPLGIAVIYVDNTHGYWQYSRDGGSSWTVLDDPTTGADDLSDSYATLLANTANNRIRFVPYDPAFTGETTINFRIWDQTEGSDGQTGYNIAATGGTTAFSAGVEDAKIRIESPPLPPTSNPFPKPPPPPGDGLDPKPPLFDPIDKDSDIDPYKDYRLPPDDSPSEYEPPPEPPPDLEGLPVEEGLAPDQEITPENEEPPPEEDLAKEEQPPEEELLPEEEQLAEEEQPTEDIIEEQPVVAVAPTEGAAVAGVVPPGEVKEAAPQENLTGQLDKEAGKAAAERNEIKKIFADFFQNCK